MVCPCCRGVVLDAVLSLDITWKGAYRDDMNEKESPTYLVGRTEEVREILDGADQVSESSLLGKDGRNATIHILQSRNFGRLIQTACLTCHWDI